MKLLIPKILLTLFLLLAAVPFFAQDIHFSQFNYSPLNLNPGLIGNFNGEFRFVGNQRTQWRSVTVPYSTYSISADAKSIFKTPFSTGLSVYTDKTGDSDFKTTQIGIGISYTLYLKDSSQTIIFGVQPAFVQRSINYSKLHFDNQYNGTVFDANLSNGESFQNSGRNYFNLSSGISWNYKIAQRKSIAAGFAINNITTPKQTFFNDNKIRLKQRFTFHTNGLFKVSEKVDILPSILFAKQHKFKEIIVGASGKYHLNRGNYKALYAGIWYRNSDASYLTLGLDYADFRFGASYDLNISSLKVASNLKGGFEFSIIYILERYRPNLHRYKACPNYI